MKRITQYDCYLCRNCRTIARLTGCKNITIDDYNKLIATALTLSVDKAVPADYALLDHLNSKYPADEFGE